MHCIRCKHDVTVPGICGECASLFHFVHTPAYFKQHHPPEYGFFFGPCIKDGKYYDLYINDEYEPFAVPATDDTGIMHEIAERVHYIIMYPHVEETLVTL